MNDQQARTLLDTLVHRIAPEIDLSTIDPDGLLQEDADLDSMDFLSLVTGLHEATGIDVPERDYHAIGTVNGFVSYVVEKSSH